MGKEDVLEVIEDVDKSSPVLLLGDATIDFKKEYEGGPINKVRDTEDVRDLVAYYTGMPRLPYPLIIEGLSFLNKKSIFLLLKLVEESEFSIVLLSRFDNISPIILSRVKTTIKYQNSNTTSELLSMSEGLRLVDNKLSADSHYFDRLKYISKYSPPLYYIESKMNRVRNKNKIINILS